MDQKPEIGMGVTESVGSDSYAYTVVKINSPSRIVIQQDDAIRTDKNGMSETQEYRYEANLKGKMVTLTLRKDGRWREQGSKKSSGHFFSLGHRRFYYDFSF